MLFLHGTRDTIIRDQARTVLYNESLKMNIREETSGVNGMQQWNKVPRHTEATMSEEGEGIWQDLQEDCRAGGHEANSQNFH
jgi:hypothetical protein